MAYNNTNAYTIAIISDTNLSFQIVLTLLAIILNGLFITSTKFSTWNNIVTTEVLQLAKTCLVVLSLCTYIPLEIHLLYNRDDSSVSFCWIRDVLEQLSVGSISVGYLALAILRFKVWKCIGIASATIKRRYAFTILGFCLIIPAGMTIITVAVAAVLNGKGGTISFQKCVCFSDTALRVMAIGVVDFFPIVAALCIYWKLYKEIRERAGVEVALTPRSQGSGISKGTLKSIRHTLFAFWIVVMVIWPPYVTLTILYNVIEFDPREQHIVSTVFVYSKILVLLSHPIAEGIFLKQRRIRLSRICRKTKVGVASNPVVKDTSSQPAADITHSNIITENRELQTVIEEDSSLEKDGNNDLYKEEPDGKSKVSMINYYDSDIEKSVDILSETDTYNIPTSTCRNKSKEVKITADIVNNDLERCHEDETYHTHKNDLSNRCVSQKSQDQGLPSPITLITPTNEKHCSQSESKKLSLSQSESQPMSDSQSDSQKLSVSSKRRDGTSRCSNTTVPRLDVSKSSFCNSEGRPSSIISSVFSSTSRNSCNCSQCTKQRKSSYMSLSSSGHSRSYRYNSSISRMSSISTPDSHRSYSFNIKEPDFDVVSVMSEFF